MKDHSKHSLMASIARRGGPFFFVTYFGVTALAGITSYLGDTGLEVAITPLIFYPLGIIGALFLVASFFSGTRDRSGDSPRFGIIAFLWLFFAVFMVLASALYLRFELTFPGVFPMIPDWLLYGFRNAAFVLIFEVGWGVYFGTKGGWLGVETSPWPLGWLFRRSSSPSIDMSTEGESAQQGEGETDAPADTSGDASEK